jgi:hypothetical protein
MKRILRAVALVARVSATAVRPSGRQVSGRLTLDSLIDIKHPSNPQWSHVLRDARTRAAAFFDRELRGAGAPRATQHQ